MVQVRDLDLVAKQLEKFAVNSSNMSFSAARQHLANTIILFHGNIAFEHGRSLSKFHSFEDICKHLDSMEH